MGRPATCPCGSGLSADSCCLLLIDGKCRPESALALMRSRYTAYCLRREDYLLASWHPHTRPSSLKLGESPQEWLGLKIVVHLPDSPAAGRAVVEFIARCRAGGRVQRLHERSRFVEEAGRWYYVDGDINPTPRQR